MAIKIEILMFVVKICKMFLKFIDIVNKINIKFSIFRNCFYSLLTWSILSTYNQNLISQGRLRISEKQFGSIKDNSKSGLYFKLGLLLSIRDLEEEYKNLKISEEGTNSERFGTTTKSSLEMQ